MAVITPQSVIKVYEDIFVQGGHCPLAFSTTARRNTYFERHLSRTISSALYVRKSGRIRISLPANLLERVNYITFINPGHEDKTYYATLVAPPRYINNECYEFSFAIDKFQTDYVCNPNAFLADFCMIDREHASRSHTLLAAGNVYNTSLWELRTPEILPVGEDLEKTQYQFAFDNQQISDPFYYDGCQLFDAMILDNGAWSPLIYLSDIDWDDLSAGAENTTPSQKWESYKTNSNFLYDHGVLVKPSGDYKLFNSVNSNITIISPALSGEYSYQELLKDLTKWGVTGAIINIVLIPSTLIAYMYYTTGNDIPDAEIVPPKFLPNNPYRDADYKLNYYPFTYARVITPSGDIKEYHWEDFTTNDHHAHFGAICDVAEKPSMIIAPKHYRYTRFQNTYDVQGNDLDMLNIIKFDQIPTAPFSIDAYLAQVSAVAQSFVSNNTVTAREQRNVDYINNLLNANSLQTQFNDALQSGGLFTAGTVAGSSGTYAADQEIYRMQETRKVLPTAEQNVAESMQATLQGKDDTAAIRNLAPTRPAFAVNAYTPSHGAGFDHFSRYGFINMLGLSVQLREDVLDRYSAYFRLYGYKSGRCGRPFIDAWLHGSVDNDELPTWKTIAPGVKATYLKLAEGEMLGVREDVSTALINWFKQGALIINGDEYND